jgi:hypothetical protein
MTTNMGPMKDDIRGLACTGEREKRVREDDEAAISL